MSPKLPAVDKPVLPPTPPEETLAWEDRYRTRAIICAILGCMMPLAGFMVRTIEFSDFPDVSIDRMLYIDDHAVGLVVSGLLIGLGGAAVACALYYLYRATAHRKPDVPRVARFCIFVGGAITLVSEIGFQFALTQTASSWLSDNPGLVNNIDARDTLEGSGLQVLQGIGLAAQLALGLGFILVSLNAMRVGLLTRFMGILGIISGVVLVVPLLAGPVVQTFWLGAMVLLFAKKWPSGLPPAWDSGAPEPWPSQQELREEREKLKQQEQKRKAAEEKASKPAKVTAGGGADELDEDADAVAGARPHPVSKKRKKKRHR